MANLYLVGPNSSVPETDEPLKPTSAYLVGPAKSEPKSAEAEETQVDPYVGTITNYKSNLDRVDPISEYNDGMYLGRPEGLYGQYRSGPSTNTSSGGVYRIGASGSPGVGEYRLGSEPSSSSSSSSSTSSSSVGTVGGGKVIALRSKSSEVQEVAYLLAALPDPGLRDHVRDAIADYVSGQPTLQARYYHHLDRILHHPPPRDWNAEYQKHLDGLTLDWVMEPFKQLSSFSREFFYFCEMYARVIVSELALPNHQRTIPEIALGGVAGGAKYICNNILFKLALDSHSIYGSDAAAMKAAGAELTTLISLMGLDRHGMRLPLMCVVDYLGHRLVAMTLLPISKETLVYGSHNGGITVANSDASVTKEMRKIAALLNLKEHRVGTTNGTEGTVLSWPVDIEGHRGYDGNPYIVDLARTFPPEAPLLPDEKPSMSRLLRPELVKTATTPLSSDAYSGFGGSDNATLHNPDVKQLTQHLFDVVIPSFAARLDSKVKKRVVTPHHLVAEMHRVGINCRHMGRVRSACKSPEAQRLLLTEMTARTLKAQLRDQMRRVSSLDALKDVVVQHCNSFLKECSNIKSFKAQLQAQFPQALSAEETAHGFQIQEHADIAECWQRLQHFVGVQFHPDALQGLTKDPNNFYFVSSDITLFTTRVKTGNLIPFADGVVYSIMAKEAGNAYHKERLYEQARHHLQDALRSAPWDYRTSFTWGNLEYTHALTAVTSPARQMELLRESRKLFKLTATVKNGCPYVTRALKKVLAAIDALSAGRTPAYIPVCEAEEGEDPNNDYCTVPTKKKVV